MPDPDGTGTSRGKRVVVCLPCKRRTPPLPTLRGRLPLNRGFLSIDVARIHAVSEIAPSRRRICNATPPKPTIIIAQVASSGTPPVAVDANPSVPT